jgi:hypothetical protein
MDDEDDEDPADKASRLLDRLEAELPSLRDDLAAANSRFPTARAFLKEKGVANVMELSAEDRRTLIAILEAERSALAGSGKPPN